LHLDSEAAVSDGDLIVTSIVVVVIIVIVVVVVVVVVVACRRRRTKRYTYMYTVYTARASIKLLDLEVCLQSKDVFRINCPYSLNCTNLIS